MRSDRTRSKIESFERMTSDPRERVRSLGNFSCTPAQGRFATIFRKEVIQPQVLLRLPCYDFTPIMGHTLGACFLTVSCATSSTTHFRDVTGGWRMLRIAVEFSGSRPSRF